LGSDIASVSGKRGTRNAFVLPAQVRACRLTAEQPGKGNQRLVCSDRAIRRRRERRTHARIRIGAVTD
jgi:hypothetical protein